MDCTTKMFERTKQITKGVTPSVTKFEEVETVLFPQKGSYMIAEEEDGVVIGEIEMAEFLPEILNHFIEEEFQAIKYAVETSNRTLDEGLINVESLQDYVAYLILQRIDWVRGNNPDFRPQDNLQFPALISVLCQNIGTVTCDREGLILIPTLEPVVRETILHNMDKERATRISRYLEKFVPGYQSAKGYLRTKEGCADFMLMQAIANEIKSSRHDSHPVYALLASFVDLQTATTAIIPNQKYAEKVYLKALVSELVSV